MMQSPDGPYREGPDTISFRSRQAVFLAADELAYEAELRKAFPTMIFVENLANCLSLGPAPPVIVPRMSIRDCVGDRVAIYLDGARWQPALRYDRHTKHWHQTGVTYPRGLWTRQPSIRHSVTGLEQRFPPNVAPSEIQFASRTGNRQDMSIALRCLRLLEKVASRSGRFLLYPAMQPRADGARTPMMIGHHALAWARGASDRLLELRLGQDGTGSCIRPVENDEK